MNDHIYNNGIDRLRSSDRIERLELDRVVDLCLSDKNIHSVLDIGTGSGLFAQAFHKRNIEVAGIDLNPKMIETAKEFLPDADLRVAVAEEIPFDDNSFDIVFLGVVFHEVSDYTKALQEAKRVAKKEVLILEWEYKLEDFGPPIDHRLKQEFIRKLSEDIGMARIEIIPLESLILYRLIK